MARMPSDQLLLSRHVVARIGPLAAAYALALAAIERTLPVKPNFVALEVIGGVLLVGLPVMSLARKASRAGAALSWEAYEKMVATGFVAAGVPILIWQSIEYLPAIIGRRVGLAQAERLS